MAVEGPGSTGGISWKGGKSERAITAETGRSGRLQELGDVTEADGGAEKVEIKEGAVPGKHWTGVELPGSEGGGGAGWEVLATPAPGTEARFALKAANIPGKDSLSALEKALASSSPPGVGNCEIGGGVDVEDDEEITASGAADDGPAVAGVIRVEDRLLFVERTISLTTREEIDRTLLPNKKKFDRTLLWQSSTEYVNEDAVANDDRWRDDTPHRATADRGHRGPTQPLFVVNLVKLHLTTFYLLNTQTPCHQLSLPWREQA